MNNEELESGDRRTFGGATTDPVKAAIQPACWAITVNHPMTGKGLCVTADLESAIEAIRHYAKVGCDSFTLEVRHELLGGGDPMTPERLKEIRREVAYARDRARSDWPVDVLAGECEELLAELDRVQAELDAFREWLPAEFVPIPRSAFGPLDGER